ncbi:hydrogenase maturation protease [Alkalihalophilus marmarensis]|uniref:hydrogenase maturation protease n=1 Tax=Alkalihalophilus marmarensis TaxID=521377 RepID=UPI002E1DA400|nr:hydrogenase maturation protease [Alkalihalophilus marmarensis]
MKNILILGIGNQLMMDDGIGIYLIDELKKFKYERELEFIAGESDINYCLAQIERASFVIILDAMFADKEPGEVYVYALDTLHEQKMLDISPHNLHLFEVMHHQRNKLHGYLIGIEPSEVRFHIGLSENIQTQWPVIIKEVKRKIERLIGMKG